MKEWRSYLNATNLTSPLHPLPLPKILMFCQNLIPTPDLVQELLQVGLSNTIYISLEAASMVYTHFSYFMHPQKRL